MINSLIPTTADAEIIQCLEDAQSFSVIAGAGSGKTTSLVEALKHIQKTKGKELRKTGQKTVCITYTNRAVEVISSRLKFDNLFLISTLHGFLWDEISRFQGDIREALKSKIIPDHIAKAEKKDKGGQSQTALKAREKVERLTSALTAIDDVSEFQYTEATSSNYERGIINHDDMIDLASYLISNKPILRKVLGYKYPYIFVDEAQDTFENVVEALNAVCAEDGLPIIGYFGDPMQQIYDKRAGSFSAPDGSQKITKTENFRCSTSVLTLLNAFRTDVEQTAAGANKEIIGSVEMTIVQAPEPSGERRKYSDDQINFVTQKFDEALENWQWSSREGMKRLFLVRQMIARRQNFSSLNNLFTGKYASSKAQGEYEAGSHALLKPFIEFLVPVVEAHRQNRDKDIIHIFRDVSAEFHPQGVNAEKPLKDIMKQVLTHTEALVELWDHLTVREILNYCQKNRLLNFSERMADHLERSPRTEEFDEENSDHVVDKSDWLADEFFTMKTVEIKNYVDFVTGNTPLSTQHGVKGEEYKDVLVVFDDVEAAWHQYSFAKTLTPQTAGKEPTDSQKDKSRKLAYVCFSRAKENLRILFFSKNAESAKKELIDKNFLGDDQISILQ